MKFRIGFESENNENKISGTACAMNIHDHKPRRSVVQIYFADRHMTLTYYNDQFDLHHGDLVYVDGKMEGVIGRVTEINYNFKIRISDYKQVVAVIDTAVKGQFFMAGSHFLTFDRDALPRNKVFTWFNSPITDDEFICGSDDSSFLLDELDKMNISQQIAERGQTYYLENKVLYICIDDTYGYAIVDGNEHYEVEFEYRNGEISRLVCSCFCSYNCKHEFAAMLLLKETLMRIEKNHADEYCRTGYFAAINKATLFTYAIDTTDFGTFTL